MAKTGGWKEITGFSGYQVNKKGEVITLHYLHHNITRKLKPRKSKNGDKNNNDVNNLEWVSNSDNIKHAIKNNLISKERLINTTETMSQNNRKAVLQFNMQGKFIAKYNSAQEAVLMNNLSNVSACCRGKYKTAGGYIWRYEK